MGRLAEARGASEFTAQLVKPVKSSQLHDALVRVLAAVTEQVSAPGPQEDRSRSPVVDLRLLVAEDNAVNRQLALALLRRLGYDADVVENGREVLDALERERYDVVLMDVQMPELDGLEATRQIRERRGSSDAPRIIAMTANAMEGDREDASRRGWTTTSPSRSRPESYLARWRVAGRRAQTRRSTTPRSGSSSRRSEAVTRVARPYASSWRCSSTMRPPRWRHFTAPSSKGTLKRPARTAHTLKSSGAIFGARPFAELCRELEALAREGRLDAAAALLDRADQKWERARSALSMARTAGGVDGH